MCEFKNIEWKGSSVRTGGACGDTGTRKASISIGGNDGNKEEKKGVFGA